MLYELVSVGMSFCLFTLALSRFSWISSASWLSFLQLKYATLRYHGQVWKNWSLFNWVNPRYLLTRSRRTFLPTYMKINLFCNLFFLIWKKQSLFFLYLEFICSDPGTTNFTFLLMCLLILFNEVWVSDWCHL